jgi:hypothetical protein
MRVIARGPDDRPLDRIAVGADDSLIYVVAAESAGDDAEAVGFPKDCIFEYHAALMEKLNSVWEGQDVLHMRDEWSRATHLNSSLGDLAAPAEQGTRGRHPRR